MKVAIIFGAKSDKEKMSNAAKCLKEFGIDYKCYAISAHRMPKLLEDTLANAENSGCEVIIAGAGLAAHLPGVIASKTILPVIGVPIDGALGGLDALLSIVQMPKPIAVATVGIGNSYNAAMLAVEILAIKYPEIKQKLIDYRKNMIEDLLNDGCEIDL